MVKQRHQGVLWRSLLRNPRITRYTSSPRMEKDEKFVFGLQVRSARVPQCPAKKLLLSVYMSSLMGPEVQRIRPRRLRALVSHSVGFVNV